MNCNQSGCTEKAVARYTWPGRDEAGEAGVCAAHLRKLLGVAGAIGLHVQTIPIDTLATEPEHESETQ